MSSSIFLSSSSLLPRAIRPFLSSIPPLWISPLPLSQGASTLKIPDTAYTSNTTQCAYPSLPPSLSPLSLLISLARPLRCLVFQCSGFFSPRVIRLKLKVSGCFQVLFPPSVHHTMLTSFTFPFCFSLSPAGSQNPFILLQTFRGWQQAPSLYPFHFFLSLFIPRLSPSNKQWMLNICEQAGTEKQLFLHNIQELFGGFYHKGQKALVVNLKNPNSSLLGY